MGWLMIGVFILVMLFVIYVGLTTDETEGERDYHYDHNMRDDDDCNGGD